MLFRDRPENFVASASCAGVFVECDGRILMLCRHPKKSYGGCWGMPAGKGKVGEAALDTAKRELLEETGLRVSSVELTPLHVVYVAYPDFNFTFALFRLRLMGRVPSVQLNLEEHTCFEWVRPAELRCRPLMLDQWECIALCYP